MDSFRKEVPAQYTNLRPLGRGAFGFVVQAEFIRENVITKHLLFNRLAHNRVAIKRIPAETVFKDRFS